MGAKTPFDVTFTGEWNANSLLVVVCSSLAGYNAFEVLVLVFTTFNAYKGLYFWSLLVASAGIIPYFIGVNIVYFHITTSILGWILCNGGWICMVTGQSVVLYSRLGVVLGHGHDNILKFVKWMIIVDGCVLHSLTTVFTFGTHYSSNPEHFQTGYTYVEKIQMTGFCLQEFIISGIYIWKAVDLIVTGQRKHTHRIMAQLLLINLFIIILDIGLLALEYKNLFIAEVSFKQLCYSIKLKLEFAILSKLVEYTGTTRRRVSFLGDTQGILDGSTRHTSLAGTTRVETTSTTQSDGRPQWMYDVEGRGSIPVSPPEKSIAVAREVPALEIATHDHNFDSISPLSRARNRDDSVLMYAEAMRNMSR